MTTIRKQVHTYEVRLYCTDCGTEMESNGQREYYNEPPTKGPSFHTARLFYYYKCPKCGRDETTSEPYPHYEYAVAKEAAK